MYANQTNRGPIKSQPDKVTSCETDLPTWPWDNRSYISVHPDFPRGMWMKFPFSLLPPIMKDAERVYSGPGGSLGDILFVQHNSRVEVPVKLFRA